MTGIRYLIDESGKPTNVVIDLKKHAKLWENMYDSLIAKERADEPRESLDEVEAMLAKSKKRRG